MKTIFAVTLSSTLVIVVPTTVLYSQAARTWVSANGNNANPCSRTAPCLTFAEAVTKTAAGGQISVLDPGSFGPITILKSLTLDGNGVMAGITETGLGSITVNAGNDDVVILRNLDIHGASNTNVGVNFLNGKLLVIEDTRISGFRQSGVEVAAGTGAMNLVVSNATISGAPNAFSDGIHTRAGTTVVTNSVITLNLGHALFVEGSGVINADANLLAFNEVAVQSGNGGAGQGSATVRLSNNDVYHNQSGFVCGGGVLASAGNNRKGSNTGGAAVPCSPNAIVTQQ